MYVNVELRREIRLCIGALNDLVTCQGCELTNPYVVQKSMELDELVLHAMKNQLHDKKIKKIRR